MKNINKKLLVGMLAGFVLGVLWLVVVRVIAQDSDKVHYHANFALYINGEREEFDNFTFYEEVQSCSGDDAFNPRTRVHMHENVNHVAHIHDAGASWSHLFANLGFTLGNDVIKTDDGVFVDGQDGNELKFLLNGVPTQDVANKLINSEDVLLVSYGDASAAEMHGEYDRITRDAAEYNRRDDPATCAGAENLTITDRLKAAIGLE